MEEIMEREEFLPRERTIDVITEEINGLQIVAEQSFIEIGRRLIEAKSMLQHGEWYPWLEEKVSISKRTAQRLMKLADECAKNDNLSHLGQSKALKLLELEAPERDEFIRENDVENMTGKQLAEAIEARKRAEEEADGLREQAAERLEELDRISEEKIIAEKRAKEFENSNISLSAQVSELEQQIAEMEKAEKTIATVVEPDPTVVKERDDLQSRLDDLKKQQKELEKKHADEIAEADARIAEAKADFDKHMKSALQGMEQKVEEAKAEGRKEANSTEIEELKRKLALADGNTAAFKVYFNQVQAAIESMSAIIERADESAKEKLRAAMNALGDKMKEAAK